MPEAPPGSPRALLDAAARAAAARGYANTRVADVTQAADLSRGTFYRHFDNVEQCLVSAMTAMADETERTVLVEFASTAGDAPEERFRHAFATLTHVLAARPAAAQLWVVEGLAGDEAALAQADRLRLLLERLTGYAFDGRLDPRLPPAMAKAIAGALALVIHARLRTGRAGRLRDLTPGLLTWTLRYRAPAGRLGRAAPPRHDRALARAIDPSARGRVLRAFGDLIVERGYSRLTVSEVADRARTSLRDFYSCFAGREDAFVALVEEHQRWLLDTSLAAYHAAPDWPSAVGNGLRTFFAVLAGDRQMAHVDGLAVYSSGAAALSLRQTFTASYEVLLAEGYKLCPSAPPVAAEAIGASVAAIVHDYARRGITDRIYEAAPTATFLALAPFVSNAKALEIARGA